MKSEFEVYMETGILGGYIPERAIGLRNENMITPIYGEFRGRSNPKRGCMSRKGRLCRNTASLHRNKY